MPLNRIFFAVAFAIGLVAVGWVGWGFVGSSLLALAMTGVIAGVYLLGAAELRRFRAGTAALGAALAELAPSPDLGAWLDRVPAALRNPVRARIEGERVALPGPALTPYLVGLLVMLGMLGTFLGMVVTFKGAVFALEGSADLQAIRAALAAPIRGLGLAFGTSVAGVATSAMLGLMSALVRRDRQAVVRQLDQRIATVLRPFSLVHQRQEAFKALQAQTQALPAVVDRLQALMEGIERRGEQLDAHLGSQQAQFHREVGAAYTELAAQVGQSLKDSLAAGAQAAGDSLRPVVQSAMAEIADASRRTHERVLDATQAQVGALASAFQQSVGELTTDVRATVGGLASGTQATFGGLASEFGASARQVAEGWTQALQAQDAAQAAHAVRLEQALAGFAATFEQRSQALLASLGDSAAQAQSAREASERERLAAWTGALASTASALQADWQRTADEAQARQQAMGEALAQAAGEIAERTSRQAGQSLDQLARLLGEAEALVGSRIEAETNWLRQQGDRMDQLAGVWRAELGALREQEAARGEVAVQRLGELQEALASQLATLGTALEAPMARLMQTASEVPQAAAQVIGELRQEMSRLAERDHETEAARADLLGKIGTLLQTLESTAGAQRAAVEGLVTTASAVLEQTGSRFADTLGTQAERATELATQVGVGAAELASLGEAFQHGVALFSASHEKLIDSLQRVEATLQQSAARSDEQLAYYVAQAREVIDLSMTSQQHLVEDLRQLREPRGARGPQPSAQAEGAAG